MRHDERQRQRRRKRKHWKRGKDDDDDDQDDGDDDEERRERLVRTLSTSIRRAGKVARAHETTRTVRRLKNQRESLERLEKANKGGDDDGDGDDGDGATPDDGDDDKRGEDLERAIRKARRRASSLERRLDLVKRFDADVLVGVCLRRLGLAGVGVDVDAAVAVGGARRPGREQKRKLVGDGEEEEHDDEGDEEGRIDGAINRGLREASAEEIELVESMLLHKKLSSAMDASNERVTEYRRNLMRRNGEGVEDLGSGANRRNRGQQRNAVGGQDWSRKAPAKSSGQRGGSGSMFVGSLSGEVDDDGDDGGGDGPHGGYFRYGPGALDEYADVVQPKQKNRKGQRARRAKAMAEEARRRGERWDGSINWRERKGGKGQGRPNHGNGGDGGDTSTRAASASGLRARADVKASEVAEMGKSWKEEGKAHPSWAAKQHAKQQTGIVKFAGKKITFD